MKKLAVLLGVLLVLALAAPSMAAVSTDITGKVKADLYYHAQHGPTAYGSAEASVVLTAGSEGNFKAVLDIAAWKAKADEQLFSGKPFSASFDNPAINSAYIQATGAWIKGMPDTVTKVGRFATAYSDWVAKFRTNNGIEVSGIDLGVGGLSILAARSGAGDVAWYPGGDRPARIFSVSGSADIDVVNVKATMVNTTDASDPALPVHTDFAVETSVNPVDGLSLTADFASDGLSKENAYRVGATLSTLPSVTLNASTWSTGENFDPVWSARKDDKPDEERAKYTKDQKGFEVGASTTQSGIDLGVKYNSTTKFDGTDRVNTTTFTAGTVVSETTLSGEVVMKSNEANAKIKASAERDFSGVNGKYTLEIGHDKKVKHTINASTTIDTPIADGVNLGARVILEQGQNARFGVGASWQAPNGVNLLVDYANYDRVKDQDGWGHHTDPAKAGLLIKAGVEASF